MTLREALEKREQELLELLDEAKRLNVHSAEFESLVAAQLTGLRHALGLVRKEEE
ncbi:unnamed protein product [marine sediment metagenome]|uniref:Uncharacterized protein n=1 Tax=marine sediment metagenome TaxID=412755 RepID=X1GK59_9ZZZZ